VDCSLIDSAGDYPLPVAVVFPPLFTLLRQNPENVTLTVSRKEEEDADENG
jgi:hypothetical protein